MDRFLNRRLLVAGRKILPRTRQSRLRLGRIARRVCGGSKGFCGVDLGLCGGDGFAGAIGRTSRGRRRRDGQGHCARSEERHKERSTKHGVLLPMTKVVVTGLVRRQVGAGGLRIENCVLEPTRSMSNRSVRSEMPAPNIQTKLQLARRRVV